MLKNLLFSFLLVVFAAITLHAQQLNANGSKATQPVNLRTAAVTSLFSPVGPNETVRPLTEINTDTADAYPYLSSDGLRLYCIENDTGYYMYSRATTNDVFSNRTSTGIVIAGVSQGIWLTNDEKMVYYSYDGIYFNTRTDITQPFSNNFKEVTLVGVTGYGPSLTPDTTQLFLSPDEQTLLMYKKTGPLTYTVEDTIEAGVTITGPSQLSKDGMTIYLTISVTGGTALAYLTRASLSDKFSGTPILMDSLINNSQLRLPSQPSVSADGTIVVYVNDTVDSWGANNLYIASEVVPPTSSYTAVTPASANSVFSVYPNPASGMFNVQLNSAGAYTLNVYNATGTVVKTTTLAGTLTQVYLGAALPGIYYVTVYGNGLSATQKVVVQ